MDGERALTDHLHETLTEVVSRIGRQRVVSRSGIGIRCHHQGVERRTQLAT